jgi:LysM repeat protein
MRQRTTTSRMAGAVLAAVPFVALALVVYFAAAGREQKSETQLVVVKSGDTLTSIGRRFGVRPDEIAALNAMSDPSSIYPNQVLLVPMGPQARVPRTLAERVRALTQIPPGVEARRWNTIVVHHSASASGDARSINAFHTYVRRWPNGLGYHFVIGNGTGTPDGFIEAGPRWAKQMDGAHAKSPGNRVNQTGIGICLVGNFEETEPTDAQMEALVALVRRLQRRYNIPTRNVIGHRDVIKGYTVCPGRHFSIERLREML